MKAPLDHRGMLVLFLFPLLLACDAGTTGADSVPPDGGAPALVPSAASTPAPVVPADAPLVVFLGDSLSAGLHLAKDEAFPALLHRSLATKGLPYRIVNAGVSGSTTAAGLARIGWILDQEPDVVVIQLGANDGFRGIPLETIEKNLDAIVTRIEERGSRPLLLEMRLPPNYGREYAAGFAALYARVADATEATFVPFFMEGVAGEAEMNLADGIHPTPEGHRRLAANLEGPLAKVLRSLDRAPPDGSESPR